ncbi:MAG: PAS domain S-box protein [Bacteriovorax sp.]|nr:PAS domain S-box protein [Bacteriovorax sp.]
MLNSTKEEFNGSIINLNALLQSMIEGMILQDQNGKILQFNQAALDILGVTAEQLTNRDLNAPHIIDFNEWDKIFPGKKHSGMNSFVTKEIQKNLVLRIFRHDGEVRWITLNAVPIIKEHSPPALLICTFTDITETRRALNDFKQAELLFNISHDLMIIANQEGYFKRINPRFINSLGYGLKEIISQKFLSFVHPDDLTETESEIKKSLDKKIATHFINRYKTKNNDYRLFDWVVVPDMETNLIYFTARDITNYRAEELALIHSSKVYSIGELTSGITFALSSELSNINSHISLLRSYLEQEKVNSLELQGEIKIIEDSAMSLSKTIKELTIFARNMENEKLSNISLNRIIENIITLCKERFRIHGVQLKIRLEGDHFIYAKESQITHLLISILNNAYSVTHSLRESWVELAVMAQDHLIKIIVTNSNPFTETQDLIHLNIPKGIVEENSWRVYFDRSSPFTSFVIELPKARSNTID